MKTTIRLMLCAALLVPATGTFAADENGQPGMVNYFTPAEKDRAFGAAQKAGYTPTGVEAFQDGNFFLGAKKAAESYEVTVLRSGEVYASSPVPPTS